MYILWCNVIFSSWFKGSIGLLPNLIVNRCHGKVLKQIHEKRTHLPYLENSFNMYKISSGAIIRNKFLEI